MGAQTVRKQDNRIEFRLPSGMKEKIEKAAFLKGRTLSDYAKEVLSRDAEEVIRKHSELELSDRDRDRFLRILSEDPKPNAALLAAAKRYRKTIANAV
jgi:uncharacterized protein (DUF1778 family)